MNKPEKMNLNIEMRLTSDHVDILNKLKVRIVDDVNFLAKDCMVLTEEFEG